jgi:branched-subunit amino acid ABC-type transport system permease component
VEHQQANSLIIMGVVITAILFVIYEKTPFGRSMRAVAFHRTRRDAGHQPDRVFLLVLGLGTAIAGFVEARLPRSTASAADGQHGRGPLC